MGMCLFFSGDDANLDVNRINGLTQYVQQVLEEAKEHITNASPIATPTEGFDDTDSKYLYQYS